MRTVWKFPFVTQDEIVLMMPAKARVLTVQLQNGTPTIWAEVESTHSPEPRIFHVYGTGRSMPELRPWAPKSYLGTYQEADGQLVWHVYEVQEHWLSCVDCKT